MSLARIVLALVALLVGATVATPVAAGANSQSDSTNWQTLESEHFLIKYQSGYQADAERTLQYMRFARNHTLDVFDTRLENKVEVYVHPWDEYSRSKWAVYTETQQADDGNGLDADVHLMAPSERPSPTQEERRRFFRHGMTHEYAQTHMYYGMLQNGNWVSMPSWLNQGIPEYVAMYHTTDDIQNSQFEQTEVVREMITQDSGYLMSISQEPYKSGPLVVKYIVDEYGWDAVMGVLRTEHSNALLAFESNLGVSVREFQDRWLVHASEEYGGDYPQAEARLADTNAHRTEDLLVRLDSKNETIDELRARLAAQKETIEEQDETIAYLRDALQNQSDGASTTDAADPAETTDTSAGSSGVSSPGFGAGVALLSLLAAGAIAVRRRGG
ncbi:PGF-CTERM sorting domain-containing protein [Halobacterium zhouii]|uniref:PGF-CTERM sorting domain-containing protein n=1 Tax=Halobacterium zhouii TaxID=2902624 RepID=UPI001E29C273|nr:PGF-CTERM sorting domain-containing protein [Halobacterium zhouii]